MPRKKRTKKLTVAELKSYIEGAVELNPEDWSPNKEQWDSIVEMIMAVKEEAPVVVPPPAPQAPVGGTGEAPVNVTTGPSSVGETTLGESSMAAPVGRFDASANPAARPVAQQTMTAGVGQKDERGVVSSGITVKTPSVDTSERDYESGFK